LRLPAWLSESIAANLWAQAVSARDRQRIKQVNIRQTRLNAVMDAREAAPDAAEEAHFMAAETALEGSAAACDWEAIKQVWQRYGRPEIKADEESLQQAAGAFTRLLNGDTSKN
jgi:hypothetical protein